MCSGHFLTGKELRPMSHVFRVDLAAGRFCVDDCASTAPLASVSYGEIVFQNEVSRSGEVIYRSVNRESGLYYADRLTPQPRKKAVRTVTTATCDSAPFTGFPARRF
jgi:hypothetical protein